MADRIWCHTHGGWAVETCIEPACETGPPPTLDDIEKRLATLQTSRWSLWSNATVELLCRQIRRLIAEAAQEAR